MVLSVRTLGSDDAAAWRELRIEAIRTYPASFLASLEEAQAETVAQVAERLAQGESIGLFDKSDLIGMAGLRSLPFARAAHRAEIGGVYIRPAHHGTGAADTLMTGIVAQVRTRGVWQLELYVAEKNPRAIRFYERHGFVRQGRVPNTVIGPDGPETDLFLTRDLRD